MAWGDFLLEWNDLLYENCEDYPVTFATNSLEPKKIHLIRKDLIMDKRYVYNLTSVWIGQSFYILLPLATKKILASAEKAWENWRLLEMEREKGVIKSTDSIRYALRITDAC